MTETDTYYRENNMSSCHMGMLMSEVFPFLSVSLDLIADLSFMKTR